MGAQARLATSAAPAPLSTSSQVSRQRSLDHHVPFHSIIVLQSANPSSSESVIIDRHMRPEPGGELVRGESGGRRRAAAGGAGLGVRTRRGLQRHPARRPVLRSGYQGVARVLRVQRLLPAQWASKPSVQLQRRRLHRVPGTKDRQLPALI